MLTLIGSKSSQHHTRTTIFKVIMICYSFHDRFFLACFDIVFRMKLLRFLVTLAVSTGGDVPTQDEDDIKDPKVLRN